MGGEFAKAYPKIAARLGMDGTTVADPYVERLIEGFAFVAARIRLKLDAQFPNFSEQLLQIVYPQFLSPLPAMGIVEFALKVDTALMSAPVSILRGTALRAPLAKGESTACEFRTAQNLTVWPLLINQAKVFSYAPDLPLAQLAGGQQVRGGVRLQISTQTRTDWHESICDELSVHLKGSAELPYKLLELILARSLGVLVLNDRGQVLAHLGADQLQADGFSEDQALLPDVGRSFVGYRLLQEYFAFTPRFAFFKLSGLKQVLKRLGREQQSFELVFLSSTGDAALEPIVNAEHFSLNAVPVVNLFERAADRVLVTDSLFEHQLVVDRSRPADYEVHSVKSIRGFNKEGTEPIEFAPFYAGFDAQDSVSKSAFFTIRRQPALLSDHQKKSGTRSSYVGHECFISLVDPNEAPYPHDLDQLAAQVLVTNRDLAVLMLGTATTRLSIEGVSTVDEAKLIQGPSRPQPRSIESQHAWRLISHLSLNYLSLLDLDRDDSAAPLKELLALYCIPGDQAAQRQIDMIRNLRVRPVVRRLRIDGPIAFARGLEVVLTIDESGFAGSSAFIFATVLERFLAHYVSVNSFTQLILISETRGEISRWPARSGYRMLA